LTIGCFMKPTRSYSMSKDMLYPLKRVCPKTS
jgi:hypothetical protein